MFMFDVAHLSWFSKLASVNEARDELCKFHFRKKRFITIVQHPIQLEAGNNQRYRKTGYYGTLF
jgi:hypothetical protein